MNKSTDTIITSILTWPHNVGVIILTTLLWSFCCYFGYYSTNNFDMLPTIEGYIAGLALVSILIGALGPARWRKFIKLGVITEVAAIFALVTSKSLMVAAAGLWIFSPISMFCFFMLIKNIWIESDRA
jgi:hypothetical protein